LVLAAIGYTEMVETEQGETIPNPLTPVQFAQQWIIAQVKRAVRRYRIDQAQATAKAEIAAAIGVATDEADALGVR